ncbi:hypothetical protein OG727_34125 [Streptomyces caniferus]|uniref:Uncharacterized protein n=1 Tax=Streptomyces caniferus TaxID=285557 RepID=A0ABZ1VVU0_9ACTN|nr:hypothetical protein [Streptomyces caniferus]
MHDQLADELGERGEDVEDQAPAGGGGVEGFVQALKADLSFPEPADDGDQVPPSPALRECRPGSSMPKASASTSAAIQRQESGSRDRDWRNPT